MPHMKRESEEALEAARLIAEAYADPPAAAYRNDIETAPQQTGPQPVPQPGRPPMSQRATDHATLVLAYSLGSLPVGAATSLVLWSLASVDPATLAIAGAVPPALAVTIGVAARMFGRAVADGAAALPHDEHHHYEGPTYVQHTELHTTTRGVLGRTTNTLPPHND